MLPSRPHTPPSPSTSSLPTPPDSPSPAPAPRRPPISALRRQASHSLRHYSAAADTDPVSQTHARTRALHDLGLLSAALGGKDPGLHGRQAKATGACSVVVAVWAVMDMIPPRGRTGLSRWRRAAPGWWMVGCALVLGAAGAAVVGRVRRWRKVEVVERVRGRVAAGEVLAGEERAELEAGWWGEELWI
ncbi:hypothetical protein EDC01DRAFT_651410 [Geopyxis carbonaria]|nr:hypothetical protein EDC01DRAFT_651410 [Geopyxis carbonaria]